MPSQHKILKLGKSADQKYAKKVGQQQFGAGNFKVAKSGSGQWVVKQTQLQDPKRGTPQTGGNLAGTPGFKPINYEGAPLQEHQQERVEGPSQHTVDAAPQTTSINQALPYWAQNQLNSITAAGQHHMKNVQQNVMPAFNDTMSNLQDFHSQAQGQMNQQAGQGALALATGADATTSGGPAGFGNLGGPSQATTAGARAMEGQASVGLQAQQYQGAMAQMRGANVAQAATKAMADFTAGLPQEYTKMYLEQDLKLRDMVDKMTQWRDQLDASKWQAQEGMELDAWSQYEQMSQEAAKFNSNQSWEINQFGNTYRQNDAQFGHTSAVNQNQFHNEMAFNRENAAREDFNNDRDYIYGKSQDRIANALAGMNAQAGIAQSMGQLGLSAAQSGMENQQFYDGLDAENNANNANNAADAAQNNWKNPNNLAKSGWRQVQGKPGPNAIKQGKAVKGTDGKWWVGGNSPGGSSGGGGGGGGNNSGGGNDHNGGNSASGQQAFKTFWGDGKHGSPAAGASKAASWFGSHKKAFTLPNGNVDVDGMRAALIGTGGSNAGTLKNAVFAELASKFWKKSGDTWKWG